MKYMMALPEEQLNVIIYLNKGNAERDGLVSAFYDLVKIIVIL